MAETHPTADAFMRRILADPTDPLPRLVFADWLDETGSIANRIWARYLRLAEEIATPIDTGLHHEKLIREFDRVGGLIRAHLAYRGEIFVAYPEMMQRVIPTRCMLLDLTHVNVPRQVCQEVGETVVRTQGFMPIAMTERALYLAIPNWRDVHYAMFIQFVGREAVAVPAVPETVEAAIARHYPPPPPPIPSMALNPAA